MYRSYPLDDKALEGVPASEIVAQYKVRTYTELECFTITVCQGVPSNAVDLPNQSAAEREKNRYRNVLPSE